MIRLLLVVLLAFVLTACAARYRDEDVNPPTNTFGPKAGTPDITAPGGPHADGR